MSMTPEYELQFSVMIHGATSADTLADSILAHWPAAQRTRPRSFDLNGNYVGIWPNDHHDESLVDSEDGFLYYQYVIEVSPASDSIGVQDQVKLATTMAAAFQAEGLRAEIVADFEELLRK